MAEREEADKLAPASIPLGRIAELEEVANLMIFLASDVACLVNGTMTDIDGGQEKVANGWSARPLSG
jgi:3-oxoacyl-[acyl-carrier protein] reductase